MQCGSSTLFFPTKTGIAYPSFVPGLPTASAVANSGKSESWFNFDPSITALAAVKPG